MRDVDDLLRATRVPEPPASAPPFPRTTRRWPAVLAIAAALTLVVGAGRQVPSIRGLMDPVVRVDLQVAVERGGVAVRAVPGGRYRVGERAFFRLDASRRAHVELWVDGPEGHAEIGSIDADGAARDIGDASGLTAWRFDEPGTYVFGATTTGMICADGCPRLSVEVE
jgi:hypothetical protein